MSDFITIVTDVLDYVNRPSSELLSQAKREVNLAILWLQRKQVMKMTERLIKLTYPANTLFINLSAACEGKVRNLINVQKLSSIEQNVGVGIRIESYDLALRERMKFQGRWESINQEEIIDPPADFHGEFTSDVQRVVFCLVGENNVALYPTPQQETYYAINLNIWLPLLSADADTNFLLVYAYDLILMRAVRTMSVYLKEDNRQTFTGQEFADAFQAFKEWDASIRAPAT